MTKRFKFPEGVQGQIDAQLGPAQAKPSKYHNEKTQVDGIWFDSKKEARRYGELRILERAGKINDLEMQPKFSLDVNGTHVCNYIADFRYNDTEALHGGGSVIEDVKGVRTKEYRLKKKLFEAVYRHSKIVEL